MITLILQMADKIKRQWIKKTKDWDFFILEINESNFVNILLYCNASWVLREGFKLWLLVDWWNISEKQKWKTKSNFKCYESEKNIRNYVGKCKSSRKRKRKGFYGRNKNILVENNSTPTNSTPTLFRTNLKNCNR